MSNDRQQLEEALEQVELDLEDNIEEIRAAQRDVANAHMRRATMLTQQAALKAILASTEEED